MPVFRHYSLVCTRQSCRHAFRYGCWNREYETATCPECGAPATVDQNYWRGLRRRGAQVSERERAVIYRRPDPTQPDGFRYSYPARPDAPPPAGYEKVEMNSLHDLDMHAVRTGAWNDKAHYTNPDTAIPSETGDDLDFDGGVDDGGAADRAEIQQILRE